MKSIFKNKILAIIMAVVIGITGIVSGLVISANSSYAATRPEMSDLTFTTDVGDKPILKGSNFKLIMTFSTKRTDTYWSSIDISVGPLNADKTDFDVDLAKKLDIATHYDDNEEADLWNIDYGDLRVIGWNTAGNGNHLHKDASADQHGCARISMAYDRGATYASEKNVVITLEFTTSADIAADSLTFGVVKQGNITVTNGVSFGASQKPSDAPTETGNYDGILTTNEVTVNLIKEEDDTFLKTLSMGPDATNLTNIDLDNEPYGYTINQAMDNLVVKPETEVDSATAQVGISDGTAGYKPSGALAADGTITFPRPNHNDKVVVLVTSQSGKEALYEVTITISYVRLEALTVTAGDGTTTGSTSLGLQETFDKDTFNYTVNVPEDETSGATAKVTPTVISGYDASTTIGLAGTNCTVDASVTSATEFTVSGIKKDAPATVTMTTTAADGTTTQDYVLTFATLSTDASITAIQAVAAVKTYDNDSTKAAEKSVDYYFYLDQESVFEAAFLITVADGASVTITDEANNSTVYADNKDKKYPLGTYTVTVAAAAGNTQDYTVILAAPELIELTEDSDLLFLFEERREDNTKFRRAYIEFGYVHGVDDKDWTCHIVLGNVGVKTTINGFLANIKPTLHPFLKLYNNQNELFYDRGNPGADYPEGDFDNTLKTVGTGWRLELCSGENVVDTVYISVLGDLSGDGVLSGNDTGSIAQFIKGNITFDGIEYYLAAYLANSGALSANDTGALMSLINEKTTMDQYINYVPLNPVS